MAAAVHATTELRARAANLRTFAANWRNNIPKTGVNHPAIKGGGHGGGLSSVVSM